MLQDLFKKKKKKRKKKLTYQLTDVMHLWIV